MKAEDETRRAERVELLLSTLLQDLERQPELEVEAFLSDHPEEADLLRERLHRLERFGLLATGSLSDAEASEDHAADPDPRISLDPAPRGSEEMCSTPLLSRLASHSPRQSRYEQRGLLGRGGMGVVHEIRDRIIGRSLAKKVIDGDGDEGGAHPVAPNTVARFIEEAQVMGQLDHPGIVPVHELGLDAEGRVYFTMKLVAGRNLAEVFEAASAGDSEWTRNRLLGIILKVCETMAYAHDRGVIHRDLKPTNVMVGRFGEVYVMDWGLARVMASEDASTLRRESLEPEQSTRSPARPWGETRDGEVLGTPLYMAPEQACGEVQRVGTRSDVYSVGAILHQLLTGHPPYVRAGETLAPKEVLDRVLSGPPRTIDETDRDLPPELVAICRKAMAWVPGERYPTMRALVDDLESFLDGRGVSAYESSAIRDLKRWVVRNKPTVAGVAAGMGVVMLAGAIGLRYGMRATRAKDAAIVAAEAAEGARAVADEKADRVLGLAAAQRLEDLVDRANRLWPVDPGLKGAYELWLTDAREFGQELERHEAQLAELRERALPWTPEQREEDRGNHPRSSELEHARWVVEEGPLALDRLRSGAPLSRGEALNVGILESAIDEAWRTIDALEPIVGQRWNWRFASTEDQWWHDRLLELTVDMRDFLDEEHGLITGISEAWGWGVQRRLNTARTLEESSLHDARARSRWQEAIASIQDATQCPAYGGLILRPQVGLLPLGRDPDSGLWEFVHLVTGELPVRDREGHLEMGEESGVVLVLLPGGTFVMGAQSEDPAGPNFDPEARDMDGPPHRVELDPFLISKYEMTQGQWMRFTGANPSYYAPDLEAPRYSEGITLMHPVEAVSWEDSERTLVRMGLALPTEAQWEYAARGGTSSVWWTGSNRESLAGAANIADPSLDERMFSSAGNRGGSRDGFPYHAPVDSMRPNPYGLHNVHGNITEWCSTPAVLYSEPARAGDGERAGDVRLRSTRGGDWGSTASEARSAYRTALTADGDTNLVGLRPARVLSR